MKIKTAVGAALFATALNSLPAMASAYVRAAEGPFWQNAVVAQAPEPSQSIFTPVKVARRISATKTMDHDLFTVEYGDTLPPVGFVNFCAVLRCCGKIEGD